MADWIRGYLPQMAPELLREWGVSVMAVPDPSEYRYLMTVVDEIENSIYNFAVGGAVTPFEFYERLREELEIRRGSAKVCMKTSEPEPTLRRKFFLDQS